MKAVYMSCYARFLAKRVTGNNVCSGLLFNAAPMHDIGKIGIPAQVLLKPGRLNPSERAGMQKHVEYGVNILSPIN